MTTKTAQQSVEMILVRQLASYLFVPVLVFDTTGTVDIIGDHGQLAQSVDVDQQRRCDCGV